MSHSLKYYATITFFLISIVVQGFGELITVRRPAANRDDTEKITCMSDDEDAAFIWNYDSTDASVVVDDNFTSFHPDGPILQATNKCEIGTSDSRSCFVEWKRDESSREWTDVNSISNPMGPVRDYRWERFNESTSPKTQDSGWAFLSEVATGTVVFSVRGSEQVEIVIGERTSSRDDSCIRIFIQSEKRGKQSEIRTCSVKGYSIIANDEGEQKTVIKEYEWRTFTVKWNRSSVQVFNNIDDKPFLHGEGEFGKLRESHVSIFVQKGTRIRVHEYNYKETRRNNATISTDKFHTKKDSLCLKLLVGLCSECELKMSIVDERGTTLYVKTINGNKASTIHGLLTWQSQSIELQNSDLLPKNLSLRVQTFLRSLNGGEGHWAIDNVRTCKADGTIIGSTVTVRKSPQLRIVCQKLFYGGSDVINVIGGNFQPNLDKNHYKRILENWKKSCGSSCGIAGKGLLICNSKSCGCDRGFSGKNCIEECALGRYGYNYQGECKLCKDNKCNNETGYCKDCENSERESPLCAGAREPKSRDPVKPRIDNLTADPPSDTAVTLRWRRHPPTNGKSDRYEIVIEKIELLGCNKPKTLDKITMSPDIRSNRGNCEFRIPNLHPYAKYRAIVTPLTFKHVPKVDFETKQRDVPTAKVSNLRFDKKSNRIEWGGPEDCTTITGGTEYTKLVFKRANDSKSSGTVTTKSSYYYSSSSKLDPFTSYKVYAYISRDSKGWPINDTAFEKTTFTTPPAAPPKVTNLKVYAADADRNTISLQWLPPSPARGIIETYHISIAGDETSLGAADGNKTGCQNDYVCYNGLVVPKDAKENKTLITVYAKNRGVETHGESAWIFFVEAPSKPQDLTAALDGQGNIELKWKWEKPSASYTELSHFEIRATVVESKQAGLLAGTPFFFNHTVQQKKKSSYTRELSSLPISTLFQISVVAVNVNNFKSSPAKTNASTKGKLAFKTGEEVNIKPNKENGTWIDLKIPTVENTSNNTWINIIVKGPVTCLDNNSKPSKAKEWNVTSYRAAEKAPKSITIGADYTKGTLNCKLQLGKRYKVEVVVKDETYNETVSKTSRRISLVEIEDDGFNAAWLIILPIVAVILLAVFLIRRRSKKRNRSSLQVSYAEVHASEKVNANMDEYEEENLTYGSTIRQSSTPPRNPENRVSLSHVYAVPFVPKSSTVSMMCFEEYAKEITFSGHLATQYTTFPRGLTKPCDYGRLPQNMPKNRNKNLIAYDQTRVVLDKNHNEPFSDYINANYIQGYGEQKAYIATQGPKANTVNDFWRMIWQKKVLVICMLSNVIEDGEKVCEEYWPPIGSKFQYGDIIVFNMEHQVFADYTNRTFEISDQQETRKLTHLHYTGWPSRGVPMYSQSLVAYLKKLVETLAGRGPVVVHCSEGDGRTGTVILCDMCVRQGIVERDIDVPKVAKLMCESRANMIGSPQQFLLAHVVIAESIRSISTQIPCTDSLPDRIQALRKHLPSHIQRLNESVWQERALHSFASSDSQVSGVSFSNKLPELIPVGLDVVNHQRSTSFLSNDNNYIGAISVDGVRVKNQNLTARLPSTTGLPDFWRFVAEQNIELIVILQCPEPDDPMSCDIMPGDSILVPVPYIQIVTETRYSEEGIYTVDKLILTDRSEERPVAQLVTVLTCTGWGCGRNGKPPPAGDLVSLWQASENIPRKGGLSLVLCRNGVTACGLYLAMSFLLERMAVERECDVISAVRAVRRSRPEFVQSLEQFDYLYDTALNYAKCFQTYANFT